MYTHYKHTEIYSFRFARSPLFTRASIVRIIIGNTYVAGFES